MSHFTTDFVKFFKELAANNNRDWFHANKKRYEQSVKDPFKGFVAEMIDRLSKDDKGITMEAKEAIFRINRDVRFSKDKSPYKTNASAIISSGGKKDHTTPGVYLQLGPEDVRLYSGAHMLEKDDLQRVREYIANNLKTFDKLINEKDFKEKFSEILGEKHKRVPKEFQEIAKEQPLIANKSFYFFAKLKPTVIADAKLVDTLMDYYATAKPLKQFFTKALGR